MSEIEPIQRIRTQISLSLQELAIGTNAALLVLLWDRLADQIADIDVHSLTVPNKIAYLMNETDKLISITNRQGYFEVVNNRWLEVTGYTFQEIISKPYFELIYEKDINKSLTMFHEFNYSPNATDPFHTFTNRYIKKDGGLVEIIWNIYKDSYKDAEMGYSLAVATVGEEMMPDTE